MRDPRVWLGAGLTAFFLWLALRGVPVGEVWRIIRGARWGVLLALSIPSYVLAIYLRALRWRHLTDPIQPMHSGTLFRAVSVGFMANNVFPLRAGEVIRAWYLSRETGANAAAILGSVLLERVVDILTLTLLALAVIAAWGGGADGFFEEGALLLVLAAAVPLVVVGLLRVAPDRVIALTTALLQPFPAPLAAFVERLLRRFSEGLGALHGGTHLLWIGVHSVSIWLLASTLPFVAGFLALGIEFDSPADLLVAAWLTLVAVGVAVAVPSAPGFFGNYHLACRIALERFGVPPDQAVALGTLTHAVFWVTLTALGLAVLRWRRTSLGEVDAAVGSRGAPPR